MTLIKKYKCTKRIKNNKKYTTKKKNFTREYFEKSTEMCKISKSFVETGKMQNADVCNVHEKTRLSVECQSSKVRRNNYKIFYDLQILFEAKKLNVNKKQTIYNDRQQTPEVEDRHKIFTKTNKRRRTVQNCTKRQN